jgi:deoxyribodipyrimidine photolyase
MSTALMWYRRDLRVHDHSALHAALSAHECVSARELEQRALHTGGAGAQA